MRYWLILTVLILLIIGIIFYVTLHLQYQVLFNPSHEYLEKPSWPMDFVPRNLFLTPTSLERSKEKIHSWYFNKYGPDRPTVIFCHGNSGNICHRDYIIKYCYNFNLNLILFDYRGYGQSGGTATQSKICDDGSTIYNYLRNQGVPASKIIVWGESLGGAVATYIAAHHTCSYLVLLSTFSSIDDIVAYQYNRPLAILVSLLIDTLPSKNRIPSVTCPILILHSIEDEVIPFKCAEVMAERISHSQKKLIPIRGTHAQPIIRFEDLEDFANFCHLDDEFKRIPRDLHQEWLDDLPRVARRHGLIN
jgi:pimeloyl-ACP methyl ester carboxylesterase